MADAKYTIRFMSLDDGHEWVRQFSTFEEASSAHEQALRSASLNVDFGDVIGPHGKPIKTHGQIRREQEAAERERRREEEAEYTRKCHAELEADPVDRFLTGCAKWGFIALGLGFAYSVVTSI